MSKETAIEWLVEQCPRIKTFVAYSVLKQAKAMEKEQIESAYNRGTINGIDYPESTLPLTGEQYYNETYNK
jgi:hypothetical protein